MQWKQFERRIAELIGGRRFWASSGESIDCESDRFVAQCKLVGEMSLAKLTALVDQAHRDGKERKKIGVVGIKLRAGRGFKTPALICIHEDDFATITNAMINLTTAAKLAAVVVHADEFSDPGRSHAFDHIALRQLIHDVDVVTWLKGMGALAPVKRT